MPHPTPDSIPARIFIRLLAIPDDTYYSGAVTGALLDLIDPASWELLGAATPEECAERAFEMVETYLKSGLCGVIVPYASVELPAFTLPCDGQIRNRVDFPFLYARIDPIYRVDADHFRTPNLLGRVIVGAENEPGETIWQPGVTGGEASHQLTVNEMPSHTHIDEGHAHAYTGATPNVTTVGPGAPQPTAVPSPLVTAISSANLNPTGGNAAHNNMQPYLCMKYAIYYA